MRAIKKVYKVWKLVAGENKPDELLGTYTNKSKAAADVTKGKFGKWGRLMFEEHQRDFYKAKSVNYPDFIRNTFYIETVNN